MPLVTPGPRPSRRARPLTAKRAAILDLLIDQPEPTTLAALVEVSGLHPNTVREHLEGLVEDGRVRKQRAEPDGRGRPAWLYVATEETALNDYAGLAATLAASLARSSDRPVEAARAAGEEWGHDLVRSRGVAGDCSPERARNNVVDMLDELGFAPQRSPQAPAELRLTRCPLLEAAHRHPDVVCGVHLGVVRGALDQYGVDPDGTELTPFAEPGACLLVIPPVSGTPTPGDQQ